jgi:hypothetical protein
MLSPGTLDVSHNQGSIEPCEPDLNAFTRWAVDDLGVECSMEGN